MASLSVEPCAGAETLAARPPTQPCDALALCMASWAASQKQQGDLMGTLATKLAPRLSEAVDSPRCAEVLSNTARAFAVETSVCIASMACRAVVACRDGLAATAPLCRDSLVATVPLSRQPFAQTQIAPPPKYQQPMSGPPRVLGVGGGLIRGYGRRRGRWACCFSGRARARARRGVPPSPPARPRKQTTAARIILAGSAWQFALAWPGCWVMSKMLA